MPPKSPDKPAPAQEHIGEKGAAQPESLKTRISAGAWKLLNRFTPWIPTDPDKALEVIATAPLEDKPEPEEPKQVVNLDIDLEKRNEEVLAPDESEKIAKVRKLFGLPEKSPLLDTETIAAERRKVIDQYLEQIIPERMKEKDTDFGGGFIDRGKRLLQKERGRASLAKISPTDKARRFLTAQAMKIKGLNNAQEILAQLESKFAYVDYPVLMDGKVIENLKTLTPEELNLATDRLMTLGYEFGISDFKSSPFMTALKTLSGLPEETFQKVCDELNPYFFIRQEIGGVNHDNGSLSTGFKALIDIVEKGGLTEQQKSKLEQAKKQVILGDVILGPSGEDYIHDSGNLNDILNNGLDDKTTGDILFMLEDDLYRCSKYNIDFYPDKSSAERLFSLEQSGELSDVVELTKKGLDIIYKDLKAIVSQRLKDILDFTSNPDKLEWAALYKELRGKQSLYDVELSLFEDVYEQRETLYQLAVIYKSLPAEVVSKNFYSDISLDFTRVLLTNYEKNRYDNEGSIVENDRLKIDVDRFASFLRQKLLHPPQLTEEEQYYMSTVNTFVKSKAYSPGSMERKDVILEEDLPLFAYIAQNKSRIKELMTKDGAPRASLIKEILEGPVKFSNDQINNWFEQSRFKDWSVERFRQVFPPDFALRYFNVFTPSNQVNLLSTIPEETIQNSPLEEESKQFLRQVKEFQKNGNALTEFILAKKERFKDFCVDNKFTPLFLREFLNEDPRVHQATVERLLTDALLASLPESEKTYWVFWKEQQPDVQYFISTVSDFNEKYVDENKAINKVKLYKDFFKEMISTPERIGAWETLTDVFNQLIANEDSSTRADLYLRIAEVLSVQPLTGRTEVEALENMQAAFSNLYRKDMTDFEKVTWNILKKQLPFATDERIRKDMRNKALDVEMVNAGNLSWVHQAIHNYVRAQNPDYIRALRDYLKNGDGESSERLKKFAEFYTADSKPKDDFYTPEVRESLQNAIPEVEALLDLTEKYFEINPEKMGNLISQIEPTLGVELTASLKKMENSLAEGANSPQLYTSFLIEAAKAREGILKLAVSSNGRVKSQLLSLDAVTSGLFKGALSKYLNLYFEPKMKNHSLTSEDTKDLLMILRSSLVSGKLEGDFSGFDKSLGSVENILSTFEKPDQISVRSLELLLGLEQHEMNKEWSNFIGLAQDEMIAILTRMGWTEADAKARVIMEDMVRFEKNSYKFTLEPLLSLTNDILKQQYPEATSPELKTPHDAYENVLGEKVIKINTPFNPIVSEFIYTFTAKEIPSDLGKANQFLTEVVSSPEAQADKLCQSLVKGYCDLTTGERKYLKTKIEEDELEFYPFLYYGVEGVVMLQNGQRVENPLKKIEQIYKKSIVPAMIHSLREGD